MKQIEHADAGQAAFDAARLAVLDFGTAAQRELAYLARQVIQLGVDAGREAYADPDAVTHLVVLADPARSRSEAANEVMNAAIAEITGIDPHHPVADDAESVDSTADAVREAERGRRRSRFAEAVRGVDAIESLFSAVSAAKVRLVAEAHAHAHEDLVDSSRAPGELTMHADGTVDRVVSRNQITAAALGAVLHMAPGAAGKLVRESVQLARHMPRTLSAIASGELTTYGQHLVREATATLTGEQAETFDALLMATPLADPVLDLSTGEVDTSPGAHRAQVRVVRRRIAAVTRRMDLETPNSRQRKAGFEGRYVRFGRPGHDGMTDLYASLPTVFTTALRTLLADLGATRRDGDERTTEQLHADVLMTLFSGPAALAPAAQLALGFEQPAWDDDAHVTVVDERQTLHTRSLWETIRALAAFLDLTFPDTARAMLHVDVTLETLTAALGALAPSGHAPPGHEPPGGVPPSAEALQGSDSTRVSTGHESTGTTAAVTALTGSAPTDLAAACADSGRRHRAATVRGLGDIDGDLLVRLARFADLQRIITDPITGQPIEVSTRRPSKRLRDAVINRDRTCRFPGCERPASRTDLDHVNPWRNEPETTAAGPDASAVGNSPEVKDAGSTAARRKQPAQTSPMNLACLCREHHRDKHQLHWQPTMRADGTIQWRNPLLGITTRT